MSATVIVSSSVAGSVADVWKRVVTPEGINHELGPWLRMTVPRKLRNASIERVPVGVALGRSWVLLLGFLPVDYDDLCLAEVEPGRRFLERSRLASMKTWQHERVVEERDGATIVTDRLTFEPRVLLRILPGSTRLTSAIVRALFHHRHRRLRSYFEEA